MGTGLAFALLVLFSTMIGSCAAKHTAAKVQVAAVENTTPLIKPDYAWLDSVTFELYRCKRFFIDGTELAFYLVGEFHAYNAPTSRFADSLLARLQPGLFLSEGVGPGVERAEVMKRYAETMKKLFKALGRSEPELYQLAKARSIPVVFLEGVDTTTGINAGVTKKEQALLAAFTTILDQLDTTQNSPMLMGMKMMLDNPEKSHKLMVSMLHSLGMDTLTARPYKLPESGIIDARNVLMSEKAIQYIMPEYGCILIRFGMGHSEGMIEQLSANNCDCEPRSLREFLESGT